MTFNNPLDYPGVNKKCTGIKFLHFWMVEMSAIKIEGPCWIARPLAHLNFNEGRGPQPRLYNHVATFGKLWHPSLKNHLQLWTPPAIHLWFFGKRPSVFSTKPAGKNSAMSSWPGEGWMTQQEMLLAALNSQGQIMDLLRVYDCDVAEGNVYDRRGGFLSRHSCTLSVAFHGSAPNRASWGLWPSRKVEGMQGPMLLNGTPNLDLISSIISASSS